MKSSNRICRAEEDNEPFVPQVAENKNGNALQKVKFLEEKVHLKKIKRHAHTHTSLRHVHTQTHNKTITNLQFSYQEKKLKSFSRMGGRKKSELCKINVYPLSSKTKQRN